MPCVCFGFFEMVWAIMEVRHLVHVLLELRVVDVVEVRIRPVGDFEIAEGSGHEHVVLFWCGGNSLPTFQTLHFQFLCNLVYLHQLPNFCISVANICFLFSVLRLDRFAPEICTRFACQLCVCAKQCAYSVRWNVALEPNHPRGKYHRTEN